MGQTQLNLFNNTNDWFNILPIWQQLKELTERFKIYEILRGSKQYERVLWHLQEFGQITNMQCHELYGIRHAPSVIRDIRKKLALKNEYEIINEHKTGCDRFGNACTFDVYKLVKRGGSYA